MDGAILHFIDYNIHVLASLFSNELHVYGNHYVCWLVLLCLHLDTVLQ